MFVGVPTCRCLGGWEGHSDMIIVARRPKRASKVSTMPGFPSMPNVWGPNCACIASDRRDLPSRLLIVDSWVKSMLLSSCTWRVGENSSSYRVLWLPMENYAFFGKDVSSICLEVVRWVCCCQLWEGPVDDIWVHNSSFSSLSRLVWRSRDCICWSLSRWHLSILSHQAK